MAFGERAFETCSREAQLEAWRTAPLGVASADPRFEVHRARPSEYERLWDLVDIAFGRKRPRHEYNWLYRENPTGLARCWISVVKETGQWVSGGAGFPWPIARGSERIDGTIGGDFVTHPDWQHMSIPELRRDVSRSHPWTPNAIGFSGPNEKSRAQMIKYGRGEYVSGPLPAAAFVFESEGLLERLGWPHGAAVPASRVADVASRMASAVALRTDRGARIEPVARFDAGYDAVTERHMQWPEFWCPHDAAFLDWRYLDHPTSEYVAFALVEGERPAGYYVMRVSDEGATLADLIASPEDARKLVCHAIRTARAAGCPHLNFFAPDHWPHWPVLRRCGFVPYHSEYYFSARCDRIGEPARLLENWLVVPGDRDYR